MKLSAKKIILLELISVILLLLNVFVKNILNEWTINIFLTVLIIISIGLLGFEKPKIMDKQKILMMVGMYALVLLIATYGLGLTLGYVKTAYSLNPLMVLSNLAPVILLILLSEFSRYCLLKKSNGNKLIFLLSILLFSLVDMSVAIHLYDITDLSGLLEMFTIIMIPAVAKNYMLSDFTYKYGYEPCILYQLITNVYLYIMPFFPNFDLYLQSVLNFLYPLIVRYLIDLYFQKEGKQDLKDKHITSRIITGIFVFIILVIVALFSNMFRYWIAVIGSGSMHPTIKVGDAIIIDKYYQKHLDKLKKGDVLVFKIKDTIYTHRIVKIKKDNENYQILTKGDRKGQAQDDWVVKNENVVGTVKAKIPAIGRPTVWLNRVLEENRNAKG